MTTMTYAAFDAALAQAKLGITPAELHGSVTGYLCAGGSGRVHELLAALALESDDVGVGDDLHTLLDDIASGVSRSLRKGEAVMPLLPQGLLPARADAMVDWCRGFLGGLGLAGVTNERGHPQEVRALLNDFGHIAAMHLTCDDDDEAALDDMLDFIGAGVARLHAVLAPVGRR